jgi:hypothetical protein
MGLKYLEDYIKILKLKKLEPNENEECLSGL